MRIGLSARFAKQELVDLGPVDVAEIEDLWHGLAPPYVELFSWLECMSPKLEKAAKALFRRAQMKLNPYPGGIRGWHPLALFAHRR